MAFNGSQQRSNRRGHDVPYGYPVTPVHDSWDGSEDPELLLMGQHGLTEEPSVDPRYLTVPPGGTGLPQDPENSSHFQPDPDANAYPQTYGAEPANINPSYSNLSPTDSGESA